MKIKAIPSYIMQAVVGMLATFVAGLTAEKLLKALAAYDDTQSTDRDKPRPGQLLTIREACERTRCSRHTLWRMAKSGQLPTVTVGARSTRIPEEAVIALAEGRGGSHD